MGDISEFRGLIFAGTFLLILVFIITLIPSGFTVVYNTSDHMPTVPDYLEGSSVVAWNQSYNITWQYLDKKTGYGITTYYHEWGKTEFGHDMYFLMLNQSSYSLANEHGHYILGLWFPWHKQEWINEDGINRGTNLYIDELEKDMNNRTFAEYKLQCEDFFMECAVGYDSASYPVLEDAWNNDGMDVVFGIEWDQMGTTHDAFSLVSQLLSVEPVLTGNIWIDYLIKIPLMIALVYIAYILVLRAIGALFGGGA